jgi:hypothetical protein
MLFLSEIEFFCVILLSSMQQLQQPCLGVFLKFLSVYFIFATKWVIASLVEARRRLLQDPPNTKLKCRRSVHD